jgi:hypothetical protein
MQADNFIFDAELEPLDEDIVQRLVASIHTNGDFMLFENPSERITGELRALARVENLRLRYLRRLRQCAPTKHHAGDSFSAD